MVPYCPICFENMIPFVVNAAPAPDMGALASPEQMHMEIGSMRFGCPEHTQETESISPEQLLEINKYPISRQFFKQTMRFNRKDRRKKRHG